MLVLAVAEAACAAGAIERGPTAPSEVRVLGEAIPESLTGAAGDVMRGRALLTARESANCVLCHVVPDPAMPFAGNVGPSLAGIGARLSAGEIRLRIVDSARLDPGTVMPSYYRTTGLHRVARQYRGQTILTAQEVEDVVAYLLTLR